MPSAPAPSGLSAPASSCGTKVPARMWIVMGDLHGETARLQDVPGLAEADGVIRLYHIFKDADALDRFRFGPHELDETYLRTAQARSLVAFAKEVNEAE